MESEAIRSDKFSSPHESLNFTAIIDSGSQSPALLIFSVPRNHPVYLFRSQYTQSIIQINPNLYRKNHHHIPPLPRLSRTTTTLSLHSIPHQPSKTPSEMTAITRAASCRNSIITTDALALGAATFLGPWHLCRRRNHRGEVFIHQPRILTACTVFSFQR